MRRSSSMEELRNVCPASLILCNQKEARLMRSATFCLAALGIFLTCALVPRPQAQSNDPTSAKTGRPPGLQKRVAWTSSKLTGSPEAPLPYVTERVFPNLKFDQPVTMTRAPGSDRLFVVELLGKAYSFPNEQGVAKPDLFLDLSEVPGHWRTYGMAFHPDFVKNRFVYISYVLKGGDPKGSRVARFKVNGVDPPRVDPKSETIILEWPSGGHNGGCLQFGPDGFLYISTGDGTDPNPPDRLNTGQDVSDLLASILRIDVDRPAPGKQYSVPPDNPFVKMKDARPEIWAYGLRNPWKMAFDPRTGDLWVGDVGWEMWEMIYRVERGGNYGWSIVEARQSVKPEAPRGPTPILPPTVEHLHTEARSITGGRVYHGTRLKDLAGAYVYGDYVTGKLWGVRHDGTKVTWLKALADSPLEIIDFGEDNSGELYILDHGGTINRLAPNPAPRANENFPRKLSETGLFASLKEQTPAPGVIPYSINAEPWADHALAERFFAVPGKGTLGVYEKQNLQIGHVKGAWIYPTDTVFAKTMSLELERGNPASRRRLETQILHKDRTTWRAYNYIWNDEQTDAVLGDPDGLDRTFTIKEAGGSVKQTWHFASRTECLICHTTRAGSILGFNVPQLNRDHAYGSLIAAQLRTLGHVGLFEQSLPNPLPRLPAPFDPAESLNTRARAYLHANCAHCHRRGGGGTAPFELLYELDLKKTFLIGARPSQGTFDIHAPECVAAGDPYRSVLYYRMARLGPGHMPTAGSNVIDTRGLNLIHAWIEQLPEITGRKPERAPSITKEQRDALAVLVASKSTDTAALDRLLSAPSAALYLLRAFDTGKLSDPVRASVLAAAGKHPKAEVRDLFERFLPEEQRVQRLGSVIKPAAILALTGDPARGRNAYLKSASMQCRNCHRLGNEGQEVGPDLSQISKKYSRAQLLESILEPSKNIDPAYVTYLAETTRGAVHSGLLVRKTEAEIVLKDAQGKLLTLPAREVEVLAPQQKSLMPELLLRDMTAQEVADLLEFLVNPKP